LIRLKKIKKAKPGSRVLLKTTTPGCSKTVQFLKENGIEVVRDNSLF